MTRQDGLGTLPFSDYADTDPDALPFDHARADHSHECRDCGGEIPCNGDGAACWGGGNEGCDCGGTR